MKKEEEEEIFHSIPFWHLPYSIPKFPFHSIFHSIPCPGCRFCIIIIIIITFHPNGCSQVENPEAPDFEKIASASGSFSTLSLPSSLPLPTSFIQVFPLPLQQKINRFQLPLPHPCCVIAYFYKFPKFYKRTLTIFLRNTFPFVQTDMMQRFFSLFQCRKKFESTHF